MQTYSIVACGVVKLNDDEWQSAKLFDMPV